MCPSGDFVPDQSVKYSGVLSSSVLKGGVTPVAMSIGRITKKRA